MFRRFRVHRLTFSPLRNEIEAKEYSLRKKNLICYALYMICGTIIGVIISTIIQ